MLITKEIAEKVLCVVDAGLCSGKPIPGQMCVEAAVTFALGENFSDQPSCVSNVLRKFKIALNDKNWSSNNARAKGLRRIAIAQLSTKDTLDEKLFLTKLAEMTIKTIVPKALRFAASKLERAAIKCESEGSRKSAIEARDLAYKAKRAAAGDKILSDFAEEVVQILIEMKTPGSEYVDILAPL